MLKDDRWEAGSEFALATSARPAETDSASHWAPHGVGYGSGRDALRSLIAHGMSTRGWRRLYLPSYYCQEVVTDLRRTGIPVERYAALPWTSPKLDQISDDGDVVLIVNHFGLRDVGIEVCCRAEIIEDHTHDPWSTWARQSTADWAIASLRKTLPLPDGGVLWSPRHHVLPVPPELTEARREASLLKLAGMLLKGLYLEGAPVEKHAFRTLLQDGENAIASGEISGMSEWSIALLETYPILQWRAQRARNFAVLRHAFSTKEGIQVLPPLQETATPFSCILICESAALRDQLLRKLLQRRVYPAVLWRLVATGDDGMSDEELALSARMLSLHCDMRYDDEDIQQVIAIVSDALACSRNE